MTVSVKKLIDLLSLTVLDETTYEGQPLDLGLRQLYGGLIFSQAISAAVQCQDLLSPLKDLSYASALFLNAGNTHDLITYQVEILKQGKSFDFFQIKSIQNGTELMRMQASFHVDEGGFSHQQPKMPSMPEPYELVSEYQLIQSLSHHIPKVIRQHWLSEPAFDIRPLFPLNPFQGQSGEPTHRFWFQLNDKHVPISRHVSYALMSYLSDHNLLPTALRPHNKGFLEPDMQVATINHSIWFHECPTWIDWGIFDIYSPIAKKSLALSNGSFFDSKGYLIATTTQEGLIRQHR